jgi:peptide methionine sulfoxide reductase msrA/msrB
MLNKQQITLFVLLFLIINQINAMGSNIQPNTQAHISKAYFAGGCFWGVEHFFEKQAGVVDAISGYMGGALENPTYRDVSYTHSGHIEVVEVQYDSTQVDYETLARLFFEIHDPTQIGGQGPDIGDQYVSVIFFNNETEKNISNKLIDILKEKGYEIATTLQGVEKFWRAEAYHQNYYDKKGGTPYCHAYIKRF